MSRVEPSSDGGLRASLADLRHRADLLRRLREFFDQRGFIEIETPLLATEVIPELHIEPLRADEGQFLQASPELHMKRLLAAGATAIYQVTRSFRAGECGPLHNPEFTIVEWYRVGDDLAAGMDLLDGLLQQLLGAKPARRTTYAEVFQRVLRLSPHQATAGDLVAAAADAGAAIPPDMEHGAERDEWLNLLLATRVEPTLGREGPEIIYHYPASQASLAKVVSSPAGYDVAERFELYYRGVELANGFHELADPIELRRRFEEVNASRATEGRATLPMPEQFLAAVEHLPDCTGCALGFDRLAMLAVGARTIDAVMAFPDAHRTED